MKRFGAVGDGLADDGPAIQAAVDAANSAGGGIVYFPPVAAGQFYRLKKPALDLGSIMLDDVTNVTFMGDGSASYIQMFDDSASADWYGFYLFDGTRQIRFTNLRISGAGITNSTTGNDLIHVAGEVADANTGTGQIEIEGCYLDDCPGTIFLAEGLDLAHIVRNLHYANNATQSTAYRVAAFAQDGGGIYVQDFTLEHNLSLHAGDTHFLYRGTPAAIARDSNTIRGNVFLDGIQTSITFTQCVVENNVVDGADNGIELFIAGADPATTSGVICANIAISSTVDSSSNPIVLFKGDGVLCAGNVAVNIDATTRQTVLSIESAVGKNNVVDNVVSTNRTTGMIIVIDTRAAETLFAGNLVVSTNNNLASGTGMLSTAAPGTQGNSYVGNLFIAAANASAFGITLNNSGSNPINDVILNYNMVVNFATALRYASSTFAGWRATGGNNLVGATTSAIVLPTGNIGISGEGVAGPGEQIAVVGTTPSGNVSAPSGSLCCDTAGGQATAVSYKETGTGVSGGTAGWRGVGGSELAFGALNSSTATAARFFAPGSLGLVTETSTEIQMPLSRSGILRNFYVRQVGGTTVENNTFRVRKNGVNTALVIIFANTTTGGGADTNTNHAVPAVAGDLISVSITKAAVPVAGPTNIVTTMELV